jgi:hypothetical protein
MTSNLERYTIHDITHKQKTMLARANDYFHYAGVVTRQGLTKAARLIFGTKYIPNWLAFNLYFQPEGPKGISLVILDDRLVPMEPHQPKRHHR